MLAKSELRSASPVTLSATVPPCHASVTGLLPTARPGGATVRQAMRVAIVSHRSSATNLALATRSWNGVQPELLSPRQALLRLGRGDRALARLDVRDDLDGIEEGLWAERLRRHHRCVDRRPSRRTGPRGRRNLDSPRADRTD